MPEHFPFDVFLSHNHQDKPRVRKLAERLRDEGVKVWLDEWIIRAGDIISLKVDEGLEQSRVLLLCISPTALASGWVALERSTAIHRDPANAGRRFIPLLLGDCDLPDTIRRYKYLDFREESDASFADILATCRPGMESFPVTSQSAPDHRPSFYGAKREVFLDHFTWSLLLQIGDWQYDHEAKQICGAGVHSYLVSSKQYGQRSFTIRARLSFFDFQKHMRGNSEEMNAGIILGWISSDDNPRYYNLLITGERLLLERIGFHGEDAYRDFEHVTHSIPFPIQESRTYSFCIVVSNRNLDVYVDDRLVVVFTRPNDLTGGVGLRPWRSRMICHQFIVNE